MTGSVSCCNTMRRIGSECVCPGDRILYECSLSGGGSTVWKGTLFHCPTKFNELFFLHSRFDNVTEYCNSTSRSIAAHAIQIENHCFTSQLTFSADPGMTGSTVMCVHDKGDNSTIIGSHNVTITTGKLVH